jgi:hypothetical protein
MRRQRRCTIDVDVPLPAGLIGATTRLVFLAIGAATGRPDVLFENPHLVP